MPPGLLHKFAMTCYMYRHCEPRARDKSRAKKRNDVDTHENDFSFSFECVTFAKKSRTNTKSRSVNWRFLSPLARLGLQLTRKKIIGVRSIFSATTIIVSLTNSLVL